MGQRVTFSQKGTKDEMISLNGHWPDVVRRTRYGKQSVWIDVDKSGFLEL